MESSCSSTSNNLLIGGIAIEPTLVQGKDPIAIASDHQSDESRAMTSDMDKSSALPPKPSAQPLQGAKKPRGRPRKVEVQSESGSNLTPPVAKRGRGRPKKIQQQHAERSNGMASQSKGMESAGLSTESESGPSITDTNYNPSCIDKLMEDMMSKKLASKPSEKTKRPVGRPRKRPLDIKEPATVKKSKGDVSFGSGAEEKSSVMLTVIPQDESATIPLPLATKVNSEPSKLKISKAMVDKMISKIKTGQVSLFVVCKLFVIMYYMILCKA